MILGYKGMLGQALHSEFSNSGYNVSALDKEDVDVTNYKSVEIFLDKIAPSILINATAINAVDKIEEDDATFDLAKKVNGEAVGKIAELCDKKNIVFIHYSSDYVFDGNNKEGYKEDHALSPINKYGETKLLGEDLLKKGTDKFYLIRLSKLFGKPAISVGAKKSFVDTMVWLATEGGKTHLDLVDEEMSSPTYAPDLAKYTKELFESKRDFGIYHGTNNGVCSWYEFGKKIFEIKKINVDVALVSGDKFPRPAKRPAYSELLNCKMPKQRNWQEALKEYLLSV